MTIDAVALMDDPKEQRLSGEKGNEVDACKAAFWGHKEIGFFMGTFSDGFLTRFMAISGVRAFFIWSHFQRNTTRPVASTRKK